VPQDRPVAQPKIVLLILLLLVPDHQPVKAAVLMEMEVKVMRVAAEAEAEAYMASLTLQQFS
jgi:hypothetical protein